MKKLLLIVMLVILILSVSVAPAAAQTNKDCAALVHHDPNSRFLQYFRSPATSAYYSSAYDVLLVFVWVAECGKYLFGVFSTSGNLITHFFPKVESRSWKPGWGYIWNKLQEYAAVPTRLNGIFLIPLPLPCEYLTLIGGCGSWGKS